MGAAFFSGWQLWQKLVFILGCGIALTICLGGAKFAHTHWRLRKYSAVAEKERKEQAVHREMSQKRRGPGVPRADEVPFGIRALERGVEVEGVWISRENTPAPSIRDGSSGSSIWDFMPKTQKTAERDLEKQEQQSEQAKIESKRGRGISEPNNIAARSAKDRPASAENLTLMPANHNSLAKALPATPARSKHPPPSFAKYSGNPSLHRQSSSVQTFEGIEAVYRASTYLNPEARHGGSSSESYTQSSSGSSSAGSDPISSAAPALLGQKKTQARPRHHSADFELLNSHRKSQAAETGQLTPRTRKPTQSMDFSQGYASEDLPSSGSEDLGYFGVKKSANKARSTPSSPRKNSTSPPKVAALPAAVRRTSLPDVTPFAQFVQTAPTLPRPASLQSPIAEEKGKEKFVPLSNQPSTILDPSHQAAPSGTATPDSPAQAVTGAVRPSFEKERRPSQVLRGHGTGFEILKPGSLPAAVIPPASPPHEKQNAVPPISLQNYVRGRSRSSSTGSAGRKLQKKRRPSIDQDGLEAT